MSDCSFCQNIISEPVTQLCLAPGLAATVMMMSPDFAVRTGAIAVGAAAGVFPPLDGLLDAFLLMHTNATRRMQKSSARGARSERPRCVDARAVESTQHRLQNDIREYLFLFC